MIDSPSYKFYCYPVKIKQDNLNLKPKVGMIVLETDLTCESDFYMLRKKFLVDFDIYVNRIRFNNPVTVDSLLDLVSCLHTTVSGILPNIDLDAIVFNCTAASALLGNQKIIEAIAVPDVPIITTAFAVVDQMKKTNIKKIDMLCPYTKEVSIGLADYFESCGLKISSLTYMNVEDDRDIAKISEDDIIAAAKKSVTSNTDALFISCTGLRSTALVDILESTIKKKVFTSNYSTFKHILFQLNMGSDL